MDCVHIFHPAAQCMWMNNKIALVTRNLFQVPLHRVSSCHGFAWSSDHVCGLLLWLPQWPHRRPDACGLQAKKKRVQWTGNKMIFLSIEFLSKFSISATCISLLIAACIFHFLRLAEKKTDWNRRRLWSRYCRRSYEYYPFLCSNGQSAEALEGAVLRVTKSSFLLGENNEFALFSLDVFRH